MRNTQPQAGSIEQLHSDVAAFNEEMRQAPRARPALVPFGLGALAALAVFAIPFLVLKL